MQQNQRIDLIRLVWAVSVAVGTTLASGCGLSNGMLRQRAIEAIAQGRLEAAQTYLLKAVEQNPGDGKAQFYLGRLSLQLNQPLEAQLALEQALIQKRDTLQTPEILDLLAEALYRQNQHEKLFAMLEQAVVEYGTTHDYLRQGDYLAKMGDADNAIVSYRKAANIAADDDARPYFKMAEFLEKIGDTKNAVTALRQAYHIAPDHPGLADRLRGYGLVPGPTVALPREGEEISNQ